MATILLLDDESNVLHSLKRTLTKKNWEIHCFDNPFQALKAVEKGNFDLILSDFRMPEMDGVTFLEKTKNISPDIIRIILSGHADLDNVMDSINRAEIYRFLTKPCNPKELISTLQIGLKHRKLELENKELANLMRAQQSVLDKQKIALERLEKASPGITKLDLDDDGAIIMNVEEYLLNKKDYW